MTKFIKNSSILFQNMQTHVLPVILPEMFYMITLIKDIQNHKIKMSDDEFLK